MANLTDVPEWEEGIYQIEKTDRVLGGPGGPMNKQAQQLGNRTAYLKEQIEATNEALTEHKEAEDPYPQYVTQQEMTDYVGTVVVQGQVNADWNATEGAAEIKNKPGDFAGATAETAGKQGFVPAPEAGDEEKVLTGSGEWKHASGVPIGFIGYYSAETPPAGFLKCDGSAVGRETYPELYAAIGTTFGAGDGSTTFNLPDLIGRFAEGSVTPGTVKEAGLPNITGVADTVNIGKFFLGTSDYGGAISSVTTVTNVDGSAPTGLQTQTTGIDFNASRSNPIYGKSDTVQPPALTLLPCIKAFDAAVDSGLIDITGLANDLNDKADVDLSNVNAAGKAVIANLGMPSSTAVSLTYTEGGQFTVPADGYLVLRASTSQGGIYIVNISNGIIVSSISEREWALGCVSPVKKGDIVQVSSWQASSHSLFFLYAEGSQP